jgi:hypothetical protein
MRGSRKGMNAIQQWIAILTKPSTASFEAEEPYVNRTILVFWLVISGALLGLLAGRAALATYPNAGVLGGVIGVAIRFLFLGAIAFPIEYLAFEGLVRIRFFFALGRSGEMNGFRAVPSSERLLSSARVRAPAV